MLTGRTPNRTGVYDWIPGGHAMHLPREEITIATLLRARDEVERGERYKIELALGEAYAGRGDLEKAIESLQKAVELDPELGDPYGWLTYAYARDGRYEKAIASGDYDSGTSRRILGNLLTWMAERSAPVFIVATANSIDSLPPELVRKGRLDEIFFVDLPDAATRAEIFAIHLRSRGLKPVEFDLTELANLSGGFSGAEIEQAIVAGLYLSREQQQPLDTGHLATEIRQTRPLSQVMAEKIDRLRAWARERTVAAD